MTSLGATLANFIDSCEAQHSAGDSRALALEDKTYSRETEAPNYVFWNGSRPRSGGSAPNEAPKKL